MYQTLEVAYQEVDVVGVQVVELRIEQKVHVRLQFPPILSLMQSTLSRIFLIMSLNRELNSGNFLLITCSTIFIDSCYMISWMRLLIS